jgi:acyl-CoA thioesterase II
MTDADQRDLRHLFDLEPHGPDTFVGTGPRYPWGGLYGGQIVAQALHASAATVDDGMSPHSLRAYFIRRGDHTEPVRYEVDRIRNGRSFATRRVVARQAIGAILNLEASFQHPETTDDVTTVPMAPGVPSPESLAKSAWTASFDRRWVPTNAMQAADRTGAGRIAAWLKVTEPLGDDQLLHRCWLAYLSDDLPTDAVGHALRLWNDDAADAGAEHADGADDRWAGVMSASLDHTIWFHREVRADEWHLHDFTCHGYVGGRGLSIGHIFSIGGDHVATVAQEVLLRRGAR